MTEMKQRFAFVSVAIISALGILASAGPAAAEQWLHVSVKEQGEDGATVEVNLPVNLVHKAVPLVERATSRGRVEIGDEDFDGKDLKELLRELDRSPDGEYVRVRDKGDHVRVAKQGAFMLVKVEEHDGKKSRVDARIPMTVINALASGEDDQLNISAALDALAKTGDGELVTVVDDDGETHVRVWVDTTNEQS
jgi:hypothetical protein